MKIGEIGGQLLGYAQKRKSQKLTKGIFEADLLYNMKKI